VPFIDFMKEQPETESPDAQMPQQQKPRTASGESDAQNGAIVPQWRSGWNSTGTGKHETRRHVGESARGFHPGVEAARRITIGQIAWGEAYATPEKARAAATQLERIQREAIEECEGD